MPEELHSWCDLSLVAQDDELLFSNSSPQRGEEAIQSEQTRTLGVQVRGEVNNENRKVASTLAESATHVANSNNSRKVAFTEPSRGMSGAKVEQTSAETLSFRCVCERCRLTRGDVGKSKCKVAFTLAEVLITLGIIGVVVALTLPTLIEKHREQVTVNKVKKFYSNINQAYMMAKEDNDSISNWVDTSNGYDNIAAGKKVIETIMPYMKILKYCGNGKDCGVNTATYLLNGEYWTNYSAGKGYYKLILADGSVMWLRTSFTTTDYCKNNDGGYKNVCGVIWYDVNGEQSPNTIGKDIFSFIMLENGIMPNKDNCVVDKAGWGCTSYILQNGNMDYLHKK